MAEQHWHDWSRRYVAATFAERRACAGKTKFPSRKNASARARVIGGAMNAYRCSWCRGWHIGHRHVA